MDDRDVNEQRAPEGEKNLAGESSAQSSEQGPGQPRPAGAPTRAASEGRRAEDSGGEPQLADDEGDEREDDRVGGAVKHPRYWSELLSKGYAPGEAAQQISDSVRDRAQRAPQRLRSQLIGLIKIELTRSNKRFEFDWRDTSAQAPAAAEAGQPATPQQTECTITLSEDDLLRIASGDLNPQVGMLSDKIRVQGRPSYAIYFFNLVAPPPRRP